ncbi:MAG: hypothetical protein VX206_09190 [Pseudomonadota bacterium]|jgi:Tol biopolymer transport system component|nr:hypothetical protein [Pseudomonadales bacterium]MEE3290896.1 hypothetical protein [Pseudomonadota bacterium]GIT20647.1 MAG: hypothetical protein CM1200mP40_03290 [Gammaproteobacteria bacterium]
MKKLITTPFLMSLAYVSYGQEIDIDNMTADQSTYSNPVVFQRFENTETNAATPDIPGFYGGASIWVMESDGSSLKLLRHPGRGLNAKHLDHPSVSSDAQYVIYAEFENAEIGRRGEARLYKENLQTQERIVIREQADCAIHHATLSLDDKDLTYNRDCGRNRSLVTELGNLKIVVDPVELRSRSGNGMSAGSKVVYQNEKPPGEQSGRRIAIVLSEFDKQGNRTDRQITDWEYRNRRATISQNGNFVAWQTNSTTGGEKDDILILDLNELNAMPVRITKSPANDGHPFFSRDSEWLLFESDRTGNWEIFKLHIHSGEVMQLTDDPDYVSTRPRW